ncbi:MAG: hypothetical protein IV100_07210 [Myxococcales bacterium]|nr:hypothetical protein [Myxococcales bacterium]
MAPDDLPPLSPDIERLLSAERSAPGPSPEMMSRIAARLDVSLASAATGTTAAATKAATTATSIKTATSALGGMTAIKWISAAVLSAGLGTAGWAALTSKDEAPTSPGRADGLTQTARPGPRAAPASAPAPVPAPDGASAPPSSLPSTAHVAPPVASAPPAPLAVAQLPEPGTLRAFDRLPLEATAGTATEASSRPVKRPATPLDLEGERKLLSQARTALRAGDPSTTLTLLAEHRTSHPRGALVEEREALRIIALAANGDPVGASRAAERFRARFKKSVHDGAIRAALGQ